MPFRDHNPSGKFPAVTILLIALNTGIFIYQFFLPSEQFETFIQTYALVPVAVNLAQISTLAPFFTSMFLHGSLLHIFSNMLFLWVFGDNIEAALGHLKYFLFYILGGLVATFTQYFFISESSIPLLGASGAIAAVLGGYLILYPKARIDVIVPLFYIPFIFAVPAFVMLGYWFIIQIFSGFFTLGQTEDGGVAFIAHAAGFVAGLALINIFAAKRGIRPSD